MGPISRFYFIFDRVNLFLFSPLVDIKSMVQTVEKEIFVVTLNSRKEDDKKSGLSWQATINSIVQNTIERDEISDRFNSKDLMEFRSHVDLIQGRCSALLSHVSVLSAVILISLSPYYENSKFSLDFFYYIIFIEFLLYLYLALLCVRCLKSFGFEKYLIENCVKINPSESITNVYNNRMKSDIITRYVFLRVIEFGLIILTLIFIITMILKYTVFSTYISYFYNEIIVFVSNFVATHLCRP